MIIIIIIYRLHDKFGGQIQNYMYFISIACSLGYSVQIMQLKSLNQTPQEDHDCRQASGFTNKPGQAAQKLLYKKK